MGNKARGGIAVDPGGAIQYRQDSTDKSVWGIFRPQLTKSFQSQISWTNQWESYLFKKNKIKNAGGSWCLQLQGVKEKHTICPPNRDLCFPNHNRDLRAKLGGKWLYERCTYFCLIQIIKEGPGKCTYCNTIFRLVGTPTVICLLDAHHLVG